MGLCSLCNGTIGKSLVTPTGGDSYSSGKNYGGLMAMDPTQVNYIVKHHDLTSDIQTDPCDPPDKILI
ncbi:hypothetical protein [Algoriphagus sp.]|uniref:hypothetical protein n=1 Tax=Algoriphagus sp. TaxID=1872435 RepID=UPI003F6FF5FD